MPLGVVDLFFIVGFGHKLVKSFGTLTGQLCESCNARVSLEVMRVTTWISLFCIPIIPYRWEFLLVCPICKSALKISKIDFESIIDGSSAYVQNVITIGRSSPVKINPVNKYAGKTETQIAYLKQMEELEKRREIEKRQ